MDHHRAARGQVLLLRKLELYCARLRHFLVQGAIAGATGLRQSGPLSKYVCEHTDFYTKQGGVTAQTSTKEGEIDAFFVRAP
jgi:hypothetical protein